MSRIPTALLKAIVSTRATADCIIRSGPSALIACEQLAKASAASNAAEEVSLNITFDYQYHRPRCPDSENHAQHLAISAAKKCLASARLRCVAAADTLEAALHEECIGFCCVEDHVSKTTHLAAANKMGEFVWRLSKMSTPSDAGTGTATAIDDEDEASIKGSAAMPEGCDGSYIGDAIVLGLAAALRIGSWKDEVEVVPGLSVTECRSQASNSFITASPGTPTQHPIDALLQGHVQHVVFGSRGWDYACVDMPLPFGTLVFPGSFNPLHHGHLGAMDAAVTTLLSLGERVPGQAYEISVEHPDKGLLSKEDIQTRVGQFVGVAPVIVSRAALYVAKTERYRSSRMLVGTDVMRKILHPKYSGGSTAKMNAELERMRARGCKFVVAGRKDETSGAFETAESVLVEAMPSVEDQAAVQDLFIPIEGFRVDVSSSAIRASQTKSRLPGTDLD